jgi:hypothetical protein
MIKVTYVEAKQNYTLSLVFNDGVKGDVSMKERLFGEMFKPLQDPKYFAQVAVDDHGVVCWPNEADLDTHALHRQVCQKH